MRDQEWPPYDPKNSKYPAIILSSKEDKIDYSVGKYCVENSQFLEESLIDPKYYPLDPQTIPERKKLDYQSYLRDVLVEQIFYGRSQHF